MPIDSALVNRSIFQPLAYNDPHPEFVGKINFMPTLDRLSAVENAADEQAGLVKSITVLDKDVNDRNARDKYYKDKLNSISTEATNPYDKYRATRRLVQEYSDDLQKGDLSAFKSNYEKSIAYEKEVDDFKDISGETKTALKKHAHANYQGAKIEDRPGFYNKFNGIAPSKSVDIQTKANKLAEGFKADILNPQSNWKEINDPKGQGRMWMKMDGSKEIVREKDIYNHVYNGLKLDPEVAPSVRQQILTDTANMSPEEVDQYKKNFIDPLHIAASGSSNKYGYTQNKYDESGTYHAFSDAQRKELKPQFNTTSKTDFTYNPHVEQTINNMKDVKWDGSTAVVSGYKNKNTGETISPEEYNQKLASANENPDKTKTFGAAIKTHLPEYEKKFKRDVTLENKYKNLAKSLEDQTGKKYTPKEAFEVDKKSLNSLTNIVTHVMNNSVEEIKDEGIKSVGAGNYPGSLSGRGIALIGTKQQGGGVIPNGIDGLDEMFAKEGLKVKSVGSTGVSKYNPYFPGGTQVNFELEDASGHTRHKSVFVSANNETENLLTPLHEIMSLAASGTENGVTKEGYKVKTYPEVLPNGEVKRAAKVQFPNGTVVDISQFPDIYFNDPQIKERLSQIKY